MPSERAGYTVSVFAIDVSPSMAEPAIDPDQPKSERKAKSKSKLDLAKEYVARILEPKITSGRKTEAAGILSFGGRTNNQANQAFTESKPEESEPPYQFVSSDVAIQTAKPKTLEEVMNLQIGGKDGSPIAALMVALDMIHVHKHTKSWALEIILITDGESNIDQAEYELCMQRFEELHVKLSLVGVGFDMIGTKVDKSKSRNKRLAEKFWRTFVGMLLEEVSKTTDSEELLPELLVFEQELSKSRLPKPTPVNGTMTSIDFLIGSSIVDAEEAISIPVKYSKATMKARPPTLSKAWKPAMDLQPSLQPNNPSARQNVTSTGQALLDYAGKDSQERFGRVPGTEAELAGLIPTGMRSENTYVIKKQEQPVLEATQGSQRPPPSQTPRETQAETQEAIPEEAEEEEEERHVAKEDLVKAWRFGSTWVPMEADTFEPLATKKGVEVLGFFPKVNLKRHHLMGEVRFVWPDISNPKGQIEFSSFVTALMLRDMVAVVRWVHRDQVEPVIGICIPEQDFPEEGKRLDFMFWIKLPFAEDEHNFWFPSLETYKTTSGKVLKEHPLLPTEEQCGLMDEFVKSMDLDDFVAGEKVKEEEEAEDEEMDKDEASPWYDAVKSYNPAIHRIKEAIFHASLTYDLDADPLGPPHPELTKYFQSPEKLVEGSKEVVGKLKESLGIKKVPAKIRLAKRQKEGLREDEGYIDIDDLFGDAPDTTATQKGTSSTPKKGQPAGQEDIDMDEVLPPPSKPTPAKPKRGRLISNQNPLEDFHRLIDGEGDVFRKAIQDLGAVVIENVEDSFSKQAFPLAIECLKAMRETAMVYEEVGTFNTYLKELEQTVKGKEFKHKDFWKALEAEGNEVAHITPEEAEAALNGAEE